MRILGIVRVLVIDVEASRSYLVTKSTGLSMKILRLSFVNEASEKFLDQVQPPTETRILRSGFRVSDQART